MKLAIIGGRDFNNYKKAEKVFVNFFDRYTDTIISGGAKGADHIGKTLAESFSKEYIEFPADWEKYGKRAGFIRNSEIIENCDMVLAFWDGESKGTEHSLTVAKQKKKPVFIIYY